MVIIFATKYEGVTLYTHFFFRLEYITKDNERHQKSIFYITISHYFFLIQIIRIVKCCNHIRTMFLDQP